MSMINQFKLDAGDDATVTVYQRGDSKSENWHTTIKIRKQKPIRQSLYTSNREKAKIAALKLAFSTIEKAEKGFSIHAVKFCDVADDLVEATKKESEFLVKPDEKRKRARKASDYAGTLNRWHKPFFKDKPIGDISRIDITKYKKWRKEYWLTTEGQARTDIPESKKKPPSPATLRREDSVLQAVFKFAVEQGYIEEEQIPHIKKEKGKTNRRPAFSLQEQNRLINEVIPDWINTTEHLKIRRQRYMMGKFVILMLHSGLRPGEGYGIQRKHLDTNTDAKGNNAYTILVSEGKTGERTVTAQPEVMYVIDNIFTSLAEWREEHGLTPFLTPDDYLFSNEYGQHIQDFSKGFSTMLSKYNLLNNPKTGEKRTIYSLRHTYASVRLLNGVDIYIIAKNMGTSVKMIEEHYAQTSGPEEQALITETTYS